mgnify:CR=1 FL=1
MKPVFSCPWAPPFLLATFASALAIGAALFIANHSDLSPSPGVLELGPVFWSVLHLRERT